MSGLNIQVPHNSGTCQMSQSKTMNELTVKQK